MSKICRPTNSSSVRVPAFQVTRCLLSPPALVISRDEESFYKITEFKKCETLGEMFAAKSPHSLGPLERSVPRCFPVRRMHYFTFESRHLDARSHVTPATSIHHIKALNSEFRNMDRHVDSHGLQSTGDFSEQRVV